MKEIFDIPYRERFTKAGPDDKEVSNISWPPLKTAHIAPARLLTGDEAKAQAGRRDKGIIG